MRHTKSIVVGWIVAAGLVGIDSIWAARAGIGIIGLAPYIAMTAGAFVLAAALRLIAPAADRLGSRLIVEVWGRGAALFDFIALLIVFSHGFAVLSYLLVTPGLPLVDEYLARADAALGFDWIGWFVFVSLHPMLNAILHYAYTSTLPVMGTTLIYLTLTGRLERSHEMLWVFVLSAIATALTCGALPSLSAPVYHGLADAAEVPQFMSGYLSHLLALRNGSFHEIDLGHCEGLVSFPSFHTAMAAIFCYALRGTRLFWPASALGALTILSVPSVGVHYLVDIPGGIVVVSVAILLARRWAPESPAQSVQRGCRGRRAAWHSPT